MSLEKTNLEILQGDNYGLECQISSLKHDKINLAIKLLDTEDYMFLSNNDIKKTLERFCFDEKEILFIINELNENRYF